MTSIDERSAAFFALGLSTASGMASGVVTTSGSAVAHLLPAAIEADRSTQPIIFFTADRPKRLKGCGANQTVNQEDFLKSVCRLFFELPQEGIHFLSDISLQDLVNKSWNKAHKFPGPVHLNIPIEEPLHASIKEQDLILQDFLKDNSLYKSQQKKVQEIFLENMTESLPILDPSRPGVVIVGPWRGSNNGLKPFRKSLQEWHSISGWPIFADPLSGISFDQPGLISNWELLIESCLPIPDCGLQVLRLGPLSATRYLEIWLNKLHGKQVLITEGDHRNLDPLGLSCQWSNGFVKWLEKINQKSTIYRDCQNIQSTKLLECWKKIDQLSQSWLGKKLLLQGPCNEVSLAYWLPKIFPTHLPIMLSASSPIRDWISYAGKQSLRRRCFGFRGASGIDGTLSLAMGLATAGGPTVLITGDLAFLHDTNGWLFSHENPPPLVVFLIDNAGGGIFNQINLATDSTQTFDRFFGMPQNVDVFSLVQAYGIPYRQISCLEDIQSSIEWSFSQPGPSLLRVCTNSLNDADLRNEIRNHFSEEFRISS